MPLFKNTLPRMTLKLTRVMNSPIKSLNSSSDFVELVNALDRALKYLVQNQDLEDQDLEQELKKDLVK